MDTIENLETQMVFLQSQVDLLKEERDAIALAHEKTQKELDALREQLDADRAEGETTGVRWALHHLRTRFVENLADGDDRLGGLSDPGIFALYCTAIPDILSLGRKGLIDIKPTSVPTDSGLARGLRLALRFIEADARTWHRMGRLNAHDALEDCARRLRERYTIAVVADLAGA